MTRADSRRIIWMVAGSVLLVLFGYAMFVAGGGAAPAWLEFLDPATQDPLAPSAPEELVLRSIRLAGVDLAVVGEQRGQAVLRFELPAVNSAPDVEIAWQAGLAALATAYPSAREYVVQIFVDSLPLLEVGVSGNEGRAAAGGASLAHDAMRFAYLTPGSVTPDEPVSASEESTPGALGYVLRGLTGDPWHEPLPAPLSYAAKARALAQARPAQARSLPSSAVTVGLDLSPGYLDAKNRAAGFIGGGGRLTGTAAELVTVAEVARTKAPGIPALPAGSDAARFWQDQAIGMLGASRREDQGAFDLVRTLADDLVSPQDTQGVGRVRTIAMTVIAVETDGFAQNTASYARLCEEVRDEPLSAGPSSDAVLVAAFSPQAPQDAKEVVLFERAELFDRDPGDAQNSSMGDAIATWYGADGPLGDPDGALSLSPEKWLGYRRADGAVYLLAGSGGSVALTDASVVGWAYETPRAALVDALDVGIARSYLEPSR